jgi:hypothetical protein
LMLESMRTGRGADSLRGRGGWYDADGALLTAGVLAVDATTGSVAGVSSACGARDDGTAGAATGAGGIALLAVTATGALVLLVWWCLRDDDDDDDGADAGAAV